MNNLFKNVQDLFTEHYKTLLRKIKENLNKWRDNCLYGSKDVVLLRWYFSQIGLYTQCNPNKNPRKYFLKEIYGQILKLIWKYRGRGL